MSDRKEKFLYLIKNLSGQYRSSVEIDNFIWKLRQDGESYFADLLEIGKLVVEEDITEMFSVLDELSEVFDAIDDIESSANDAKNSLYEILNRFDRV